MPLVIGKGKIPDKSRNIKTSVMLKGRSSDPFSTSSSKRAGGVKTTGGVKR